MIREDGTTNELTQDQLMTHGIEVDQDSSTLHVFSENVDLIGTSFELDFYSTTIEEPTWYDTTRVKVFFKQPPCLVSQEEIDLVGNSLAMVTLNAIKDLTTD